MIMFMRNFKFLIFLVLIGIGCNESLPPYINPPQPFGAIMYHYPPYKLIDTLLIFEDHYFEPPKISYIDSTILFRIGAFHQYEEVLQDEANISGYLEIYDISQPERVARVPIDNRNAQSQYISNGIITLAKGDTFWLSVSWNGKFPNKVYPVDGKRRSDIPGTGGGLADYEIINFKAKSYIQLFKKVGGVFTNEAEFKVVFRAIMRWPP